jgi:CubicO group peptidase (beta-lactamase class C family)
MGAVVDWDGLLAVVAEQVSAGPVPGAVVAVSCDEDVRVGAVGARGLDGAAALAGDAVVRIASLTKPLIAALTLILVDEGTLALDAPVERWLPELSGRRVVRRLAGPVEDTVPARRPITVDDLLTLRMGFGFVLDSPCPLFDRAVAAGLGFGPPDPALALAPDDWVARFAELPLMHQPGADWMYELGFGVLGVLLARASGRPLDDLLRERLLTPLGMADTGFAVPAAARARLITCYTAGEDGPQVFDGGTESRWNNRPVFPDARGGLVSTAPDYVRFARILLNGGVHEGTRLLSEQSVAALITDHLGPARTHSASAQAFLSPAAGWGYGVEVRPPSPGSVGSYGWGGGLGTTWYSYPARRTTAVLFTQYMPPPQPFVTAFWSTLASMLDR